MKERTRPQLLCSHWLQLFWHWATLGSFRFLSPLLYCRFTCMSQNCATQLFTRHALKPKWAVTFDTDGFPEFRYKKNKSNQSINQSMDHLWRLTTIFYLMNTVFHKDLPQLHNERRGGLCCCSLQCFIFLKTGMFGSFTAWCSWTKREFMTSVRSGVGKTSLCQVMDEEKISLKHCFASSRWEPYHKHQMRTTLLNNAL